MRGRWWAIRRLAARQFLGLTVAILVNRAGWAAAPTPPDPSKAEAVLELPEGFAVGSLGPAPEAAADRGATFTWTSPAFARPFELTWAGISRVRLAPTTAPALPAGAWRADLGGGGIVLGVLEAIDAEHVTMTAPGVGTAPLRLRRDAIVRLGREGAATRVFVPGPLAGWDTDRKVWREEAGRLAGDGDGGTLSRDVAAPARACFEISLMWDERPQFEIVFAAARQTLVDLKADAGLKKGDTYRIELAPSGELLAIREGVRMAKMAIAETFPAGAGRLWLRVFVDQETGRLAVTRAKGEAGDKPVCDESLPQAKPETSTGFGVRLRRGRMRIERLRVRPWTEPEPRLVESKSLGSPDAVLESFDKARGFFVVTDTGQRRELPLQEVSEIAFRPDERPTWPDVGVMAVFHGGSLLAGRVLEFAPPMIRLDLTGVAEPVQCDIGLLAMLENVAIPGAGKPPGRQGTIEAKGIHLPGCLANAPGAGIGWQPRGAAAANPLAGSKVPLRIVYRPEADAGHAAGGGQTDKPGFDPGLLRRLVPGQGATGQESQPQPQPPPPFPGGKSLLYLRTGDAVLCKVLSADGKGVRIRNDAGAEVVVPAAAMRAIELVSAASLPVSQTKADRLRVLPRVQRADPPTHLLRLAGGDYIRGKLVSLDDTLIRIEVAGATAAKELRRADVTRVIWLSVEGDGSEAVALAAIAAGPKPEDVPMRALVTGPEGVRRVTCMADRIAGDALTGRNGILGEIAVDLAGCLNIDVGPAVSALPDRLPYGQWRLKPATVPRALRTDK